MENQSNFSGQGIQAGSNLNPIPVNLPNSSLILILGILSIVLCWWHFVSMAGIILGILSIVLAKKEIRLYYTNPERFTTSSLNNVKTGRICAIVGLTISVIVFVFVILLIAGFLVALPFWGMIH